MSLIIFSMNESAIKIKQSISCFAVVLKFEELGYLSLTPNSITFQVSSFLLRHNLLIYSFNPVECFKSKY